MALPLSTGGAHTRLVRVLDSDASTSAADDEPTVGEAGAGGSSASGEHAYLANAPYEDVERVWQAQAPNPSWSQEVDDYVRSSLRDLQIPGRVVDVACRESLCRLVMEFEDAIAVSEYSVAAANSERQRWLRLGDVGQQGPISIEVLITQPQR